MISFKYSAPGSTMLLGEYAVLHHGWALVCAVDQRVSVQLTPRKDDQIEIISSLGTYHTTLSKLEPVAPFQFVLATLKKYQKKLKHGCTLTIESEFSEKVGLASSAAVTVAVLSAVAEWLQISYTSLQLIRQARSIVREVQGMGSGADIAACVLGGMVAYRQWPLKAEKIAETCPLHLIYSGGKIPTPIVVNQVKERFANHSKIYKQLLRSISECAKQGITAFKNQDLVMLGKMMTIQQGLMQSLGVSTSILDGIIEELLSLSFPRRREPILQEPKKQIKISDQSQWVPAFAGMTGEAEEMTRETEEMTREAEEMTREAEEMTREAEGMTGEAAGMAGVSQVCRDSTDHNGGGILGAKISGSGLGDSIIALGTLNDDYISRFAEQGAKRISMTIAPEGVRREKV